MQLAQSAFMSKTMLVKGTEYFTHPAKSSLQLSTAVTSVNQPPPCLGFLACRHHHNPPFTDAGSWFSSLNWRDIGQAGSVITMNQPHRGSCFSGWMLWKSHASSPLCWHSSIRSMLQDAGGVYSPEGGENTEEQGRERFLLINLGAQRMSWSEAIFILSEFA